PDDAAQRRSVPPGLPRLPQALSGRARLLAVERDQPQVPADRPPSRPRGRVLRGCPRQLPWLHDRRRRRARPGGLRALPRALRRRPDERRRLPAPGLCHAAARAEVRRYLAPVLLLAAAGVVGVVLLTTGRNDPPPRVIDPVRLQAPPAADALGKAAEQARLL